MLNVKRKTTLFAAEKNEANLIEDKLRGLGTKSSIPALVRPLHILCFRSLLQHTW